MKIYGHQMLAMLLTDLEKREIVFFQKQGWPEWRLSLKNILGFSTMKWWRLVVSKSGH